MGFWEATKTLALENDEEPSPSLPSPPLLVPEFYKFSFCLPPFLLQTLPSNPLSPPSRILFSCFSPRHTVTPGPCPLPCAASLFILVLFLWPPYSLPCPASGSCTHIHPLDSSICPHSDGPLSSPSLSVTNLQLWGTFQTTLVQGGRLQPPLDKSDEGFGKPL